MREIIVAGTRILERVDGQKVEYPDVPTYYSAKRNDDGTWTVMVDDLPK